jgi:hypothetical protein
MTLKSLLIYWPLLSIATAIVLCRLIHNAKAAVLALEIKMAEQKMDDSASLQGERHEADTDRRAA